MPISTAKSGVRIAQGLVGNLNDFGYSKIYLFFSFNLVYCHIQLSTEFANGSISGLVGLPRSISPDQ
jgi:hypothetical protein